MHRPSLRTAQPLRIAIPAGGQGLELAECSRVPLEEKASPPRHLECQQRIGPAEVDQIQTVGPETRGDGQIQVIQIGGAVASHRKIDVALGTGPFLDDGTEQDKDLEIRHGARQIPKAPGDELGGDRQVHAATVTDPP